MKTWVEKASLSLSDCDLIMSGVGWTDVDLNEWIYTILSRLKLASTKEKKINCRENLKTSPQTLIIKVKTKSLLVLIIGDCNNCIKKGGTIVKENVWVWDNMMIGRRTRREIKLRECLVEFKDSKSWMRRYENGF
jgi:hypothetical protein